MRISALTFSALLGSSLGSAVLAAEAVEEIVVTATFREQTLQDVPASVTVLGADMLSDAGRQHFQDVLSLVPNLNWAGGTSRPRYFQVRGIGEREQYEGAPNPSVGFLVDDIDFSGIGMPATLFDVERIEVLRGPQGTRYGANALAGLVVVTSKEPDSSPGYSVEASAGDYGTRSAGLVATAPVESLNSAWRFALQQQQSDGYMRNAYLGRDDTNERDELTGRFKWRWDASEATTVDLTILHANLDNGYDAWAIDNSRRSLSDRPGKDSQRATGASARVTTTAFAPYTFTAIASYADSNSTNSFDADWGNSESWGTYTYDYFQRSDRDRNTGTFEARLASPAPATSGDLGWLVGSYVMRMEEDGRDRLNGVYADPADPAWDGSSADDMSSTYEATSAAIFAQLDQMITERWRWSAGLRAEQRNADYADRGISGGAAQLSDLSATDSMIGGQVALSADVTESATAYVSLSRGYKAGGFNLGNIPEEARGFDPEYLWSAETGIKADVFDGRGLLETSVFYQWRRDLQIRSGQQLDPTNPGTYVFVTDNLANGYNTGVETSLSFALNSSLDVGGSFGLLRTKASGGVREDGEVVDAREQAHAPEYTASLFADWHHSSGFAARVDVSARDNFYFDVATDHDRRSSPYVLANFKVGYERDRWSAFLWMRNALDEDYAVRGFYFYNEPPFSEQSLYTQLGDPRQVGITVRWGM
jgi:iron complex outermembrane recepter protein